MDSIAKMEESRSLEMRPRFLWLLILSYSMVIITSNWFDARLVEVFGMAVSPGTLIFPLSFLISDIITEVYGYKHARRAIWTALIFNVLIIAYGQLLISLPSPSFATNNDSFDKLIAMDAQIICGSFMAYLIAEPISSFIVAKMKVLTNGKLMGLRFVSSTLVSAAIDTAVFVFIAFYGVFSNSEIALLILNVWLIKVLIEIIGMPLSIKIANILKAKENLDIYDKNTSFNLFSLEAKYTSQDNKL